MILGNDPSEGYYVGGQVDEKIEIFARYTVEVARMEWTHSFVFSIVKEEFISSGCFLLRLQYKVLSVNFNKSPLENFSSGLS